MKPTPKPTQLPTARPFTTSKPVAVSPAPKPAAATPVATKANTSNAAVEKDVYLLARLIYAEARSESSKGKMAVGGVVLNRVKHAEFPNSISGVIYQPNAFSVVKDGQINLAPDAASLKAARDCMNGLDPSGGSIFFYNPKKTKNKFLLSRKVVVTIGNHRFCK